MNKKGKINKNYKAKGEGIKYKCRNILEKIWVEIQKDGQPLISENIDNRYGLH